MRNIRKVNNEKGFTLVELLATLVILGVIAAIAVPIIGNVIQDSKDKAIIADASSIIAAAKLAQANGEQSTASDGGIEYNQTVLQNYIDLEGETATVKYNDQGWSIYYQRFSELENAEKYPEIVNVEGTGYVSEATINKYLQGE